MSASLAALLNTPEEQPASDRALAVMAQSQAANEAKPFKEPRKKRGGWDDPKELNTGFVARGGGGLGGLDKPVDPQSAGGFKQILIEIKAYNARFVIGRNGETINKIREDTGANVQVEGGGKGGRPDEIIPIRILGPAMSAEMARDQVTIELLCHSDMEMECPGGYQMFHVEMEQRYVPKVVGPQGTYLRAIETQSKARVAIRDSPKGNGYKIFRVIGRPEAAELGKQLVLEKAQAKNIGFQGSGGSDANAHPETQKEFQVQQRLVGLLVGKAAAGLKNITDVTGAGIQLNQDTKEQGFSTVKLFGNYKQVNEAYNLLQSKLTEAEAKDQARYGGQKSSDWVCKNCKNLNMAATNTCVTCGYLQPAPQVVPLPAPPGFDQPGGSMMAIGDPQGNPWDPATFGMPMDGGPMGSGGMMLQDNNFDPNMVAPLMQTRSGLPNLKGAGEKKVCPFWLSNSCRAQMRCPDRHPPDYECAMLREEYKKKPCKFGTACQNQKQCLYNHDPNCVPWQDKGEDWVCKACGCQNYARRNTCHRCWERKAADPINIGGTPTNAQASGWQSQDGVYGFSSNDSGGGASNYGGGGNNYGGNNWSSNSNSFGNNRW